MVLIIPALVCGLYFGLAHSRPQGNIPLTVDLGYSTYKGSDGDGSVSRWFGIRYAAPPTGDLRFRAPRDPTVDGKTYTADTHGAVCHGGPSTTLDKSHSEDCLFLDVYAPTKNTGRHPVFVYFQGGGFNTLSAPNLDGTQLIQAGDHDMVVVTFNYRVSAYGFLASKEVRANGDLNVGLLDQRKALQWVQKYIYLFGGDPDHVTIGGASAGGASVDLQLSAYGGRDDKLFHAAAAESQSFGAQLTIDESQYQYDSLITRVGCNGTADTLTCLRNTDIKVISEHNINSPTPGGAGSDPIFMYSNVIDGNFTADYTYNAFAQGKFVKVPSIFGDTTNEGTIFVSNPNIMNVTQMNNFLRNQFVKLTPAQLDRIDAYYPKAGQYPGAGEYWRSTADAYGDMRYICPGIYISDMIDKYGVKSNWNYHWDVLLAANAANGLGVTHTAESSSIWGTSKAPENAFIPIIQSYWASFIRSKDPNTFKLANISRWDSWTRANQQRILFPADPKDVKMEVVPQSQKDRCAYLSGIGASIRQ